MAFEFTLKGVENVIRAAERLSGAKKVITNLIFQATSRFMLRAQRTSKEKYLSGGSSDVLKVVTGRLRASIATTVLKDSDTVYGRIGTNVIYGAIHEYGGPIRRKGGSVFYMRKRPFIRRAVEDEKGSLIEDLLTIVTASGRAGFNG